MGARVKPAHDSSFMVGGRALPKNKTARRGPGGRRRAGLQKLVGIDQPPDGAGELVCAVVEGAGVDCGADAVAFELQLQLPLPSAMAGKAAANARTDPATRIAPIRTGSPPFRYGQTDGSTPEYQKP
jgi:hypothetical protein